MSSVPVEQAAQIRRWLRVHGFRKSEYRDEQIEYWFRAECGVRLTREDENYKVEILHAQGNHDWCSLGEILSRRSTWSQATTLSPIELATLTGPHGNGAFPRRNVGRSLYQRAKPVAYVVKIALQMAVGLGAVVDITWHVEQSVSKHTGQAPFAPPITTSVLVIASALAVAAAIELAYTLFTPGPDEALDPLMLGLSSGLLFLITQKADNRLSPADQFSAVLLGVLALGVLFVVRKRFVRDDDE